MAIMYFNWNVTEGSFIRKQMSLESQPTRISILGWTVPLTQAPSISPAPIKLLGHSVRLMNVLRKKVSKKKNVQNPKLVRLIIAQHGKKNTHTHPSLPIHKYHSRLWIKTWEQRKRDKEPIGDVYMISEQTQTTVDRLSRPINRHTINGKRKKNTLKVWECWIYLWRLLLLLSFLLSPSVCDINRQQEEGEKVDLWPCRTASASSPLLLLLLFIFSSCCFPQKGSQSTSRHITVFKGKAAAHPSLKK